MTAVLRKIAKQCRMPEKTEKENNDLRGSEKGYKGESSKRARIGPVAIELPV
jgi:hypothetical protein